ncbi:MAG: type II toxin-antitoxin system VapC family toxin [Candidatus Micrarchaeota archaeon]|nr:type II toxin-antitoxin system VapC family toxin [Candidatus Micrarchaeota archaeon]
MIIVDANIFIFGETTGAPEREMAVSSYRKALEGGSVAVNVIILSEVFHKSRLIGGLEGAALRIRDILNEPTMEFLEFTSDTIIRATKLARDFQMRINDALIAQQAIETGAAILTDNVKDFRKIMSIRVIPLRG